MYTGLTTVNAGTLQAGSTQAFGSTTGGMTVNAGATLDLAGFNNTVGALGGSGNVALGGATLTLHAGTATFSGIISGSGGVRSEERRVGKECGSQGRCRGWRYQY